MTTPYFTGFIAYAAVALFAVIVLIVRFVPRYGQTHMVVYIGLCSIVGSITVGMGAFSPLNFYLIFSVSHFPSYSLSDCRSWV